ncbi:MAG: serine protease [Clostridiales bacterium]|nr:serine protease [Clostridiales bacterium]
MKRQILSLICVGAILLSLAGCMNLRASENLTEGLIAKQVDTTEAKTGEGAREASVFAMKLLSLALESGDENVVISPLSAYLALAMVANGAKGDTLSEFTKRLGSDLNISDINLFCRAIIDSLTENAGGTTLSIADSVWMKKDGFVPNQDFLQAAVDYFDAEAFTSDFSDLKAVSDVNKWIEKNTNGLIKEMLKEISPDTVMLLINTLYMKARWKTPFESAYNFKGPFTKSDGTEVETTYMSRTDRMQYLKTDAAKGVLLPYDDERLGFVALLPEDGKTTADLLASISDIKGLIDSAESASIRLSLPIYKIEYECTMNDILKSAGIKLAFDEQKADLSGLGTAMGNLYIGEVRQKVVIEVNEKGTEAAAATVIDIRTTSAIQSDFALTFDKPFIYMVVDLESGIPLFVGQMDNPA